MPLTAGIVGLPNVGKSTLFNAITNSQVEAANYPFATIQPNTGTVEVPDIRLRQLTDMFKPQKTIATTFEFTDIAGLVRGASKGEGLGNQFLSHIREVDAICHVVRCFENDEIIHVEGTVDPIRDAETIHLELLFADLDTVEKRLSKVEKRATVAKDKDAMAEYVVLKPIYDALMAQLPARAVSLTREQLIVAKGFHLLTLKPMIYVANLSEGDIIHPESNGHYLRLKELAEKEHAQIVTICAKMEAELSELGAEEREEFLHEMGVPHSGLDQLIRATYDTLNLATFFTAGPKEVRAWTFKKGALAPQCAGIIHSDFEKGFIKAEIYHYDDLMAAGSESGVKDAGKFRIEGKEYTMKDGDIVHFRFNV